MAERLKERLLTIGMGILVASGTWPGSVQAQAGQKPNEGKIRVLLITGGHGFEHGPFLALFESIPDVRITEATDRLLSRVTSRPYLSRTPRLTSFIA